MPLNEYRFFEKTGEGNKETNLLTNNKSAFDLLAGSPEEIPILLPRTKSKKYPDTAKESFKKWFNKSFDKDSYKRDEKYYPDTINVRKGNYDDFLEELSHGFQLKDYGFIEAAQSLNKLAAERKKYGEGVYYKKATEEYKAHTEIGAPMIDEYEMRFSRKKPHKEKYKEPPIIRQMKMLEKQFGRKLQAKEIWELQESIKNK